MDKALFEQLLESVKEHNAIAAGRLRAGRVRTIKPPSPVAVRKVRARTGLSQSQFASLIEVPAATVKNWEQGRRAPRGPARALLKVLRVDPAGVMRALRTA